MAKPVIACETYFTGSLFGSAFTTGFPPLSGIVFLSLRLLTSWSSSSGSMASACSGRQSLRSSSRVDLHTWLGTLLSIYASFTALSNLVQQAAVKCGLLSKASWRSRLSSLRQCRAVPFQLLVQQPGAGFPQI